MEVSNRFWDKIAEDYAARPLDDPDAFQRKLVETKRRITATDRVLDDDEVTVVDNLSTGDRRNLSQHDRLRVIENRLSAALRDDDRVLFLRVADS